MLVGAVTSLLLVTVWGGQQYAWSSGQVVGLAIAALVLTVAFVLRERRAPEPILPLRLFRDPVFSVVSAALFAATCSLFAALVFVPRTRASLFMVVFGLGFGMVSQVLVIAIQNSVDRRELGIATASANFFRALGGAIGVAVFGAVFTSHFVGPVDARQLQSSPAQIHRLGPALQHRVVEAVAESVHHVFLVAAPIAAAGFVVAMFLKEYPLRGPGGAADAGPAE